MIHCIRRCETTAGPPKTDTPSGDPTVGIIGVGIGMMSAPTPFCLVRNALAFSHSVSFNPDNIGVIDNPVTDCISQSRGI